MKLVVTISSHISSFDTNRPIHCQIRQTHKKNFHAFHPLSAHAVADGAGKQLGDVSTLLNKFYGSVASDCQRVTTVDRLKQSTMKNIASYIHITGATALNGLHVRAGGIDCKGSGYVQRQGVEGATVA